MKLVTRIAADPVLWIILLVMAGGFGSFLYFVATSITL